MFNRVIFFVFIVLLAFSACRKEDSIEAPVNFLQVFNAVGEESKMPDGGYVFLSGTGRNVKLERFGKTGNKIWTSELNNYLTHYVGYKVLSVCGTNEGGVAGFSSYQDTIYRFTFLKMFKVDAEGKFEWERLVDITHSSPSPSYIPFMNDGNNNFISSYFQFSTGLSSGLVTIDSSGRLLSNKYTNLITIAVMNFSWDHRLFAVAEDFFSNGSYVYKLDTNSNLTTLFQTPVLTDQQRLNQFYQMSILPHTDGGCVVLGHSNSGSNTYNFYLQKFNPSGSIEWIKKFGTINNNYLSSVLQTKDGGLLLVGTSSANALDESCIPDLTLDFNSKVYLLKLDAGYRVQWEKTIGGNFGSRGLNASQDEDGQLYILGKQISHGNDAIPQLFILRLKQDGNY